jgi:hypothetical protein
MTVLNPAVTSHVISVIPRTYDITNAHTFSLYDEDLQTTTSISNTKALNAGRIDYAITLTTTEGKSYSFKITDDVTTLIVFRGKIFTTAQTTQNYRINE